MATIGQTLTTPEDGWKRSVASMSVGDRIPFHYKATANSFGVIDQLGTSVATEIPVTSTATPDGTAYFIMVGYDEEGNKKLVADRNIQHSISWDSLNTSGVASGSGLPISIDGKDYYTVRLLTGSTSATDLDNEWDKIIVGSTLNGVATAGDNSIWNWSSFYNWVSTSYTATNRVCRGNSTAGAWAQAASSSVTNTTSGFRPVLIVKAPTAQINIKSINPTHLYEKQHERCSIEIEAVDPISLAVKSFSLKIGSTEISSNDPGTIRIIPVSSFAYGNNIVTIQSDDVTAQFTIKKEDNYRTSVERTMATYDGGHAKSNMSFDGQCKIKSKYVGNINKSNSITIALVDKFTNKLEVR